MDFDRIVIRWRMIICFGCEAGDSQPVPTNGVVGRQSLTVVCQVLVAAQRLLLSTSAGLMTGEGCLGLVGWSMGSISAMSLAVLDSHVAVIHTMWLWPKVNQRMDWKAVIPASCRHHPFIWCSTTQLLKWPTWEGARQMECHCPALRHNSGRTNSSYFGWNGDGFRFFWPEQHAHHWFLVHIVAFCFEMTGTAPRLPSVLPTWLLPWSIRLFRTTDGHSLVLSFV